MLSGTQLVGDKFAFEKSPNKALNFSYNKLVHPEPPLLHVAPGADAGKIPYYAGKRQFLAVLKWQEAV